MEKSKEELFYNALTALLIATEFSEYVESGQSIVAEAIYAYFQNDKLAEERIKELGYLFSAVGFTYADCFEAFGCLEEYDEWATDEIIDEAISRILEIIEKGGAVSVPIL